MSTATAPALAFRHVSKTFNGVRVLKDVRFEVQRGEVHALLGENGSGKSTLVKIVSGYHEPDPGSVVEVHGMQLEFPLKPGATPERRLAFVHQNLGLVREMSVLDNLGVRRYTTKALWRIDWKAERIRARQLLARFGIDPPLSRPVSDVVSMADRALIAIARALDDVEHGGDAGVLVLDEPTVFLPETEAKRLLDAVRTLSAHGTSVVYVTHRLDELTGFAKRITVLRDGAVVGTVDGAIRKSELVGMIVGRQVTATARIGRKPAAMGSVVLKAKAVSGHRVADASLEVRAGEIVGLTGLPGMGHEQLPKLLVGAARTTSGDVTIAGQHLARLNPRAAIRAGAVLVPGDRVQDALAVDESVTANVTLPNLGDYFRLRLDRRHERRVMHQLIEEYDIRPAMPSTPVRTLSGGNQQKAVLAKWLQLQPKVVLVEEPTQGIDVAARVAVHERLRAIAAGGAGVVVSSSEYEELADLCHRVLVMRDGAIVQSLTTPLSKDEIARACYLT